MQRLLDLLKHSRYFLLLLLLEAVAFGMVSAQYNYHKSILAGIIGDVGYSLSETAGSWHRHFSLGRENERLAAENARLRSVLAVDDKRHDAFERGILSDSLPYAFIPAAIVKNSFQNLKNYIVLDKGSADGVEVDQGVVTGNGILGVIVQVTPHYSVCRSVLHADSYVSARFKKNEYFGTVDWNGKDRRYVELINIPRQAEVSVGDTIITDRRSTLFPEGLVIGTVEKADAGQQSDFYDIEVRLADDLANLRYVYILRYKYKDELKQVLEYE